MGLRVYNPGAVAKGRGQRRVNMAGREEEGSLSRKECQEDAGPGDGLRHVVKELEGGFHQESVRPDHQAPARHGPFANLSPALHCLQQAV